MNENQPMNDSYGIPRGQVPEILKKEATPEVKIILAVESANEPDLLTELFTPKEGYFLTIEQVKELHERFNHSVYYEMSRPDMNNKTIKKAMLESESGWKMVVKIIDERFDALNWLNRFANHLIHHADRDLMILDPKQFYADLLRLIPDDSLIGIETAYPLTKKLV